MKLTGEKLFMLLSDIATLLLTDDTLEGTLTYEATETPQVWEVSASYRIGNRDGQGGMRIIPPTEGNTMNEPQTLAELRAAYAASNNLLDCFRSELSAPIVGSMSDRALADLLEKSRSQFVQAMLKVQTQTAGYPEGVLQLARSIVTTQRLHERLEQAISRAEHIDWAQTRALECVDRGELGQAVSSMTSDLLKHNAISGPLGLLDLGLLDKFKEGTTVLLASDDDAGTADAIRTWIRSFT